MSKTLIQVIKEYIEETIKNKDKEAATNLLINNFKPIIEESFSIGIKIQSLIDNENYKLELSDAFYELLSKSTNSKIYTKNRILDFSNYLKSKYDINLVLDKVFERESLNSYERQIDLLKILNSSKSKREIMDYYAISRKPLEKDINKLIDGTKILGQNVKINDIKREAGEIHYESSVHPIFLPLNLTEVYSMTVLLKILAKENAVYSETLNNLANKTYSQLSDYAKEKIDRKADHEGVRFPKEIDLEKYRKNTDEKRYMESNLENKIMHIWKSGEKCTIILKDDMRFEDVYLKLDMETKEVCLMDRPRGNIEKKIDQSQILKIKYEYI